MDKKKQIAILVADAFQDSECFFTKSEVEKVMTIKVVAPHGGSVEMWSFFDKIGEMDVDVVASEANPDDFEGVIIPGGANSPATLAKDKSCLDFIRALDERNKMVASICRGSLPVAVSGIAKDRRITGYYLDDPEHPDQSIRKTVEEHGGNWISTSPVVVDGNLITSRHPDDISIFTATVMTQLQGRLRSD